MSASMQEIGQPPRCERLDHAIALLREALAIVDDVADRPDIGARLQYVLETLNEEFR